MNLDLEASCPTCNDFFIEAITEAIGHAPKKVYKKPDSQRLQEQKKQEMLRASETLESGKGIGVMSEQLPYTWKYSSKRSGVTLDCHWMYKSHKENCVRKP